MRGQEPRPRPSPCHEGHNASAPASQQKLARPRLRVRIRTRCGLSLDRTSLDKRGGRGGGLKKVFTPNYFCCTMSLLITPFLCPYSWKFVHDMQELRFKEWGCQKPESGRKSAGRGLKPTEITGNHIALWARIARNTD